MVLSFVVRWCLAILLLGCASADPATSSPTNSGDAAKPSCQTTSCVAGASCVLPTGGVCRCFDAGEWSCGDAPSTPPSSFDDGGLAFDSALPPPPEDAPFTEPAMEAGTKTYDYAPDDGSCAGRSVACTDPSTAANAQKVIASIMMKCGLACTRLLLESDVNGCPARITASNEWIEGALICTADELSRYRWPCSTLLDVATVSCPK